MISMMMKFSWNSFYNYIIAICKKKIERYINRLIILDNSYELLTMNLNIFNFIK